MTGKDEGLLLQYLDYRCLFFVNLLRFVSYLYLTVKKLKPGVLNQDIELRLIPL